MIKGMEKFISYTLPKGSLEYFEIKEIEVKEGKEKYMGEYGFDDEYTVILEERDRIPEEIKQAILGKRLSTKGYSEQRLRDFPIRGRKTTLCYRIRKWQVEGEEKIYQGKYLISQDGVKYTREFAFFFNEGN